LCFFLDFWPLRRTERFFGFGEPQEREVFLLFTR